LQHEISLLVHGSRVECIDFQGMDLALQLQVAAEATLHITPHGGVAYSLLFSRPGSASIVLVDDTRKAKDMYILPNLPWLHVMYLHRVEEHLLHVHIMQSIVQASLHMGIPIPSFHFEAAEPFLRRRLAARAAALEEEERSRAAQELRESMLSESFALQLAHDVAESLEFTAGPNVDENNSLRMQLLVHHDSNCAVFSNVSIFCWGKLSNDGSLFLPTPIQTRGIYTGTMHLTHSISTLSSSFRENIICGHVANFLSYSSAAHKVACMQVQPIDVHQGTASEIPSLFEFSNSEEVAEVFFGLIGTSFSCTIMRSSGELQCSGDNSEGQLGDGTLVSRNWMCPVQQMDVCRIPLPQPVIAVALGSVHACAVVAQGAV
jgi:hypothetical protein